MDNTEFVDALNSALVSSICVLCKAILLTAQRNNLFYVLCSLTRFSLAHCLLP